MEPNVVFVYKIDSFQYVTEFEVIDRFDVETYEIDDESEFETFNHEDEQQLIGRGYIHNDLKFITEAINESIQKQRSLANKFSTTPVHIVSQEFIAGTVRVGLRSPKVVIGIPAFFAIGPIWRLHEKEGQMYRNEWIYDHINYEFDDDPPLTKFKNFLRDIEDIPDQAPIYIWTGNNVEEQVATRYLIYLLRSRTNVVTLLHAPTLYDQLCEKSRAEVITGTGDLRHEQIQIIFDKCHTVQPLTTKENHQLQNEWLTLSKSRSVLRTWKDHKIVDLPVDFYDKKIIHTLESLQSNRDEYIRAGVVLGQLLESENFSIDGFYLEYRIRELIYQGVLAMKGIPKSMRRYRIKIRE
ncbi:DUF1835 domain-containing protein [Aquibacillus koreensis]|nr:DUF1835 domain-containing protein [Aquibacillus koreensis]